jgi:hypothetical protein
MELYLQSPYAFMVCCLIQCVKTRMPCSANAMIDQLITASDNHNVHNRNERNFATGEPSLAFTHLRCSCCNPTPLSSLPCCTRHLRLKHFLMCLCCLLNLYKHGGSDSSDSKSKCFVDFCMVTRHSLLYACRNFEGICFHHH